MLATRTVLGGCCVDTVAAGCSCGRENVEIGDVVLRDDALPALRVPPFGDDVAGVIGASSSTVVCASGVGASCADVSSDSFNDVDSVDDVDTLGFASVAEVAEESALVEADDVAPESVGSADATPGVVATDHPTPSATANAPTRPRYLP